ncbi:uncharacterized protein KIAA0825 homolog isoform X2 [Entelurus aequoreus]|nr:uncharacterized protein KIAA0825 homolog isoform X2 [Entelurus aequoreus]
MEWPEDFPEDHAFVELVVPGLHSQLDFEQLIKDTEEKLKLNANSIEQQLVELQVKMGDTRSGDRPPSPSECLQWLNVKMLNSVKPVSTGHQGLLSFFNCLQNYLRSEEDGREEATLQLLLHLSSKCGICFPCTPSPSSPSSTQHAASSSHLVHLVRDDSSSEIQEAWDDVRLQLRCHLLKRLSTHCPGSHGVPTLSIIERVQCLQQFCFLYPECEVLTHYQGQRSKAMLALLHSAMRSSPPAVTGFDRVTAAFRSVTPVLTRTLTEDLHVLPRVAEPHAILAFLNAAYLRPVAGELALLVTKESERALRDNTMLGSKIKKYSTKSRATVAPMELPVKSRSFSLTSYQLRVLTQLARTLMALESGVKELVTDMIFINCTGEVPCVKGILKKAKVDMAADNKKYAMQIESLEFDWRSAFSGLAPHMSHCVKVVLDDVCTKSFQREETMHSSGHYSVLLENISGHTSVKSSDINVREDNFYGYSERDTPKMIAKFCGAVVDEMDALLPLAAACSDTSLLDVRSSFVEACSRAALAILGRLEERALEVPSSLPLNNLPALLATCIYVLQRLQHYQARLKDPTATLTKVHLSLLPVQKYQDTVEALKEQLSSYCVQVCLTCVFQDAESHHWDDPKPFYEGERCSFSVQMWFYFLCGLRSDLWAVLPPRLAKELLGQVLSETLQVLVQRYARAQPSYQRHRQIRCDITAVLLYVEQLMWSVCESPEALLCRSPSSAIAVIAGGSDWPDQIHSLCDQLLTVLVIATAPLSLLHGTFMTKHTNESTVLESDWPLVRWLNALEPELFTEAALRDGLMGQEASACQLRLLTSDPGSNPRLLLRMLLHRECHLPHVLLENSYFCQDSHRETSPEHRQAGDSFVDALFNIYTCLNDVPTALTQALEPYLDSAHVWEHLYSLPETSQTEPVVIGCIRVIVTKSTNSLLTHLVSMATEEPSGVFGARDVPESVLAKVPKDWKYAPVETQRKGSSSSKTGISLAIQAMSFIFTNLPLLVAPLPLPIRHLFQVAEKHLSQHARQLRSVGLLLWSLLNCLIHGLGDPHSLEEISGLALNCQAKDRLTLLAECLQASMGIQQKGVPKPTVHKVLQALEEKRPKWMNMQMHKARKLCTDSVHEGGVAAHELTEQKMGLMLLEVCHRAGGSNYLRHIHHIIQGNEDFLMSKLNVSSDLHADPPHSVNFDLGHHEYANKFNPLEHFDRIGKRKLNQDAVAEWAWDWTRLLPAYQDMCQVTFKTLLANRWEMQDGAELQEDEKTTVEELRRAYFVCHCGAGLQESREADEKMAERTQGGSDKTAAQ